MLEENRIWCTLALKDWTSKENKFCQCIHTHTHTKKDCGKESKRKLVERYFESKYIRPVIHHLGVTFNCYVKHDNEPWHHSKHPKIFWMNRMRMTTKRLPYCKTNGGPLHLSQKTRLLQKQWYSISRSPTLPAWYINRWKNCWRHIHAVWVTFSNGHRHTTHCIIMATNAPIVWSSVKQSIIILSTMKAKCTTRSRYVSSNLGNRVTYSTSQEI